MELLHAEIRRIAGAKGLRVITGARQGAVARQLRDEIRERIDDALMVIFETSGFSWWVAFELFHALDRKVCAVLVLDKRDLPNLNLDRRAMDVFSELVFHPYPLPLLGDSSYQTLKGLLESTFDRALEEVAKWSRAVTRSSIKATGGATPRDFVPPKVHVGEAIWSSAVEPTLFERWIDPQRDPRPVAITAPPGAGKTTLLRRFAEWVSAPASQPVQHAKDLPPVAAVLTAADIPERFDAEELWSIFETQMGEYQQGACAFPNPGLARPYARGALLYLLFDGLDEFGNRRPSDFPKLLDGFDRLQEAGVRILVTCRESFWALKVTNAHRYEVVAICPYDREGARRLLATVRLPRTALGSDGEIKSWLLNPLMIRFVRDVARDAIGATDHIFATRSALYTEWALRTTEAAEERCLILDKGALLEFFSSLALRLLGNRRYQIDLPPRGLEMPRRRDGERMSGDALLDQGILTSADNRGGVKFFHESVYEFFAIRELVREFRTVLSTWPTEPDTSNLGRVELDFLQSSAYGFLAELLGDDYHAQLVDRLAAAGRDELRHIPWAVLRNLVEYLGMTYRGDGDDRGVAEFLIGAIEDPQLSMKVRFNAARALERIHPLAPRPYFDYVSDWGEKDWSQARQDARNLQAHPWVMRGHREDEPVAKRHGAFGPNEDSPMQDPGLQKSVSNRLGMILRGLFVNAARESFPLRLNCSWAWLRWFHPDDTELRDELAATADRLVEREKASGVAEKDVPEAKTRENLRVFVGRWPVRF